MTSAWITAVSASITFELIRTALARSCSEERSGTPSKLDPGGIYTTTLCILCSPGTESHLIANPPSDDTTDLHFVDTDPTASHLPLLVLLHAYPHCWHIWHHQLRHLRSLGYRMVALDLRGYGDREQERYQLSEDASKVIQKLGYLQCTVIALDEASAVAT